MHFKLSLILILLSSPAAAQNAMGDIYNNSGVIIQAPSPSCITMQPGISLCSDGTVKVPKGMKMSEAASKFVAELRKIWPASCGPKNG